MARQAKGHQVRSPIELIHTAARNYCESRHAYWCDQYSQLSRIGKDHPGPDGKWDYTPAEYSIFPRCNLLAALLDAVEVFTEQDFADEAGVRMVLAETASRAQGIMIDNPSPEAAPAIEDERARFHDWVLSVPIAQLQDTPQMPYRRTLSDSEVAAWLTDLKEHFGVQDGRWHPLITREVPPDVAVVPDDALYGPDGESNSGSLAALIASLGVARVFEIREWGASKETDLTAFTPTYDGREVLVTTVGVPWVIFSSHENSTAFSPGPLVDAIRNEWPELLQRAWTP